MATSPSGWVLEKFGPVSKDVSADFQRYLADSDAGKGLPSHATKYVYLLVPGLFTNHYPGYMNKNWEHLRKLGMDVRKVPLNTDVGVEKNAAVIRDKIIEVSKEGHQCIVIGHSKGGVDAAAAIAMYDLYDHVFCLVCMQAPFGGTPMSGDVAKAGGGMVEEAVLKLLKGEASALADLTYPARQAFLAQHPLDVSRLAVVSFSSIVGEHKTLMLPAAAWLRKQHHLESDGCVPEKDAYVPGSYSVRINGLDHGGTVFDMFSGIAGLLGHKSLLTPGNITYALAQLALEAGAHKESQRPPKPVANTKGIDEDEDDVDDKKKDKKKEKKDKKEDKKEKKDKKDKK